jgi:hypothetical protein
MIDRRFLWIVVGALIGLSNPRRSRCIILLCLDTRFTI